MANPMEVLPECSQAFSDIRLQVGLMEKDLERDQKLIEKLSEGIEKIQEMNTNLVKMLALHDQRHETHEKVADALDEDIEKLHSRITTESRATQDKIDALKRELIDRWVIREQPAQPAMNPEITNTMRELDRWKYILIGAAITVGWLLANINWSFVLQLFGKQ